MPFSRTRVAAVVLGVSITLTPGALAGPAGAAPAPALAPAAAPAASVAPVGAPAARMRAYTPVTRVMFNNPLGDLDAKRRLFRHLVRSIDATPSNGTIRFAVLSFADKPIADALLRAHARGVSVKLIFAGDDVYEPMKRMQRALGADSTRDSFAIFCQQSCRGTRGQMHAKFFSFSRVGDARHVAMVGSNNLTKHNSHDQWSDLYTVVDNRAYYGAFLRWFSSAKKDAPVADPYVDRVVGGHRVIAAPLDLDRHPDPMVGALDEVVCVPTTPEGEPAAKPTRLHIAQHAWNGPRGKRLARQVAALATEGCHVRVFWGEGTGPAVRTILEAAGIRLRSGTHPGVLTHEKFLIVRGAVGDQTDTIRVWTGSQNWSTRALPRDELIVRIDDPKVGRGYLQGFQYMWQHG